MPKEGTQAMDSSGRRTVSSTSWQTSPIRCSEVRVTSAMRSASGVSSTRRPTRRTRAMPNQSSRLRRWWLTAAWVTPSSSAARPTRPVWARAAKALSALRGGRLPVLIVRFSNQHVGKFQLKLAFPCDFFPQRQRRDREEPRRRFDSPPQVCPEIAGCIARPAGPPDGICGKGRAIGAQWRNNRVPFAGEGERCSFLSAGFRGELCRPQGLGKYI